MDSNSARKGKPYQSEHFPGDALTDEQVDAKKFAVLRLLDGMAVSQAEALLVDAQRWLKVTTRLDCSATDFVRAEQVFGRAVPQRAAPLRERSGRCWCCL